MVGTKERRTAIKLKNLGDIWNCSGLHKVTLLALLYLSYTVSEGLGMSNKGLKEIIKTEIRSLRTVSMIARLCRQCCKSAEVSKVNNIERKIVGTTQGLPRMFGGMYH